MAGRSINVFEIGDLVYRWQRGEGTRAIGRQLGIGRNTARRYVDAAERAGVQREGASPTEAQLAAIRAGVQKVARQIGPFASDSALAPHRTQIEKWIGEGVGPLQMTRLLAEQPQCLQIGVCSLRRYLKRHGLHLRRALTMRMPRGEPGELAEVDFGYAGRMVEVATGQLRRAWFLLMTLPYSGYAYVRFVFHQDLATWQDCHVRAFEFFGGVPAKVRPDNLGSAVLRAHLYDPLFHRGYEEVARHYGFVIDPARAGTPTDKPHVERDVRYVRGALLAGRTFVDEGQANERAVVWCREEAGMRIHGTTGARPREVFEAVERAALRELPKDTFEPADWAAAKVHPDHHFAYDRHYYSLPSKYVGRVVTIRATGKLVQAYDGGELLRTWIRGKEKRQTNWDDYPKHLRSFVERHPRWCEERARAVGPETFSAIETLLSPPQRHYALRSAQGILRLGEKYGHERLEAACRRANHFGRADYESVRKILERGLDRHALPEAPASAQSPLPGFTHEASTFIH